MINEAEWFLQVVIDISGNYQSMDNFRKISTKLKHKSKINIYFSLNLVFEKWNGQMRVNELTNDVLCWNSLQNRDCSPFIVCEYRFCYQQKIIFIHCSASIREDNGVLLYWFFFSKWNLKVLEIMRIKLIAKLCTSPNWSNRIDQITWDLYMLHLTL